MRAEQQILNLIQNRSFVREVIIMWKYKDVTREEFERDKDRVEEFIVSLGGKIIDVHLPYEQVTKTISHTGENIIENISLRPVFEYSGKFFRVDEVCFRNKQFIVIECGTYNEVMNNVMEDADPFPYDLPDDELMNEVRYSLGIMPYPKR